MKTMKYRIGSLDSVIEDALAEAATICSDPMDIIRYAIGYAEHNFPHGANRLIAYEYIESALSGNVLLDFSHVLEIASITSIKSIVDEFRLLGVEEFTISDSTSSLLNTIDLFSEFGVDVSGFTHINRYQFYSGKIESFPAIKMTVALVPGR